MRPSSDTKICPNWYFKVFSYFHNSFIYLNLVKFSFCIAAKKLFLLQIGLFTSSTVHATG